MIEKELDKSKRCRKQLVILQEQNFQEVNVFLVLYGFDFNSLV